MSWAIDLQLLPGFISFSFAIVTPVSITNLYSLYSSCLTYPQMAHLIKGLYHIRKYQSQQHHILTDVDRHFYSVFPLSLLWADVHGQGNVILLFISWLW